MDVSTTQLLPPQILPTVLIISTIFLITLFTPFIAILNCLPRWLGVYRLIWRDWYKREG